MFNRLPKGFNSSSCFYHDVVQLMLTGIDGVISCIDGILVGVVAEESQDQAIKKALQRLNVYGFHIDSNRMQYQKTAINFLVFKPRVNTTNILKFVAKQGQILLRMTGDRNLQMPLGIVNDLRSFAPRW